MVKPTFDPLATPYFYKQPAGLDLDYSGLAGDFSGGGGLNWAPMLVEPAAGAGEVASEEPSFEPLRFGDQRSAADARWLDLLQAAVREARQALEPFAASFAQTAAARGIVVSLDLGALSERIQDSLGTVTAVLELAMPTDERRRGTAQLWMDFGATERDARFGWLDDPVPEDVRLLSLIRQELGQIGDFVGPELELLSRFIVQGLQEGWVALPRFTGPEPGDVPGRLLFTWSRPGD